MGEPVRKPNHPRLRRRVTGATIGASNGDRSDSNSKGSKPSWLELDSSPDDDRTGGRRMHSIFDVDPRLDDPADRTREAIQF